MRILFVFGILFLFGQLSFAVQKAKILGQVVEVYSDADFDAEVIDEVYKDETYIVSNKLYGPFYRIKLKTGKVGYIVDYELDINGKGPMRPKDLDELELKSAMGIPAIPPAVDPESEAEENEVFGKTYIGPTVQMINYHEDTMGGEQIGDLLAIGVKSIATLSWSAMGTWQVPSYYTQRAGYSARGIKLWGDVGFSHVLGQFPSAELRFGGNVFAHFSIIKIDTSVRSYDLQDATMGINAEFSVLKKIKNVSTDFSIKYYFDKSRYAAIGVGLFF